MNILLFFILVMSVIGPSCQYYDAQCSPWLDIERKLKDEAVSMNCTTSGNCEQIKCNFEKFGYEVYCGIHINSCDKSPYVEFDIDIPKLNLNAWTKRFYHGEKFNLTDGISGDLSMQKEDNNLNLGLLLQINSGKNQKWPLLSIIPAMLPNFHFPVFYNASFPLPDCSQFSADYVTMESTSDSVSLPTSVSPALQVQKVRNSEITDIRHCTIDNSTCRIHEVCQQSKIGEPGGDCVCIPDYTMNLEGLCVYNPTTTTTSTTTAGPHTDPQHSNTSLLLTVILVPIAVILLLVGLALASIRFRICQRIRRRLRVQVYEQVLLGEEEEEDDEALNPVV